MHLTTEIRACVVRIGGTCLLLRLTEENMYGYYFVKNDYRAEDVFVQAGCKIILHRFIQCAMQLTQTSALSDIGYFFTRYHYLFRLSALLGICISFASCIYVHCLIMVKW